MKIAVLGGGNGSYAAAADFTKAGHEVRWWRRSYADFGSIAQDASLRLLDHRGRHDLRIAHVCAQIGDAVNGAELIVCPTPAFAQMDIATLLAPHLQDGQVVFLPPGTFGSVLMARASYAAGGATDVAFGRGRDRCRIC